MSVGARVVRGPDWAGKNQDGGEGGLGTVVSESVDNGKVKIVWDTGHEGHYRAGHDGRFEIRIYDNAPTGAVHSRVVCDVCKVDPVEGIRWKCATCHNFDLCSLCYMSGKHDLSHPFLRHETEMSTLVPVDSRKMLKKEYLHGILPGANVMRGLHWKWGNQDGGSQVGEVTKLVKWGKNSYRGGANVTWTNGNNNTYRCGGEGCMDLILIAETKASYYFPHHLPVLDVKNQSKSEVKKGDKVRVDVARETVKKILSESSAWDEKILDYLSQLGTVVELKANRIARLQYEDAEAFNIYTSMLTKVHSFAAGDVVQIIPNVNALQELQRGHGGWNDQMEYTVDSFGIVEEVDDDGDLKVKVGDKKWLFSPVCCRNVEAESLTKSQNTEVGRINPDLKVKKPTPAQKSPETSGRDVGDNLAELLLKLLTKQSEESDSSPRHLIEAAAQADLDGVTKILKAKPDMVNETVDGINALQMACYKGHSDIITFLLKSNADVNFADKEGDTPLHFAISEKRVEVAKILVQKQAKLDLKNKKGFTPCHLAVNNNLVDVVETLTLKGCDVNTQDKDGDTPLHDALSKEAIPEILLNLKTTKFDIYNEGGLTAFHQAIMENKEKFVQQMLKKQPSIIKQRTMIGEFTPLHIAVANGFVSLVNVLISEGKADVNARDGSMKIPLHLAVMKRSMPLVDILLFAKSDINAKDTDGNTPSHLVQMKASLATATTISATQSLMAVDDDAPIDIPYMLAQHGPDLSIKNKQGQTPTDLVSNKGYAKLLIKIANASKKTATTPKTTTAEANASNEQGPPKYWLSMDNKTLMKVLMEPTEPLTKEEHKKVTQAFNRTLINKSIVKIERIQNLDKWEQFAVKKKTMERKYGRGLANEQLLFHGTKADVVDRIVAQGIDFRLVERALYGDGAYFASESKISDYYTHPDGNGHSFMFM
ncbi:E3 ubiquitin-protein ligase MIB2-like, partial [Gigantopelta aegis]|uniref:E3 ubiquitin-protein ligase MIB2-like n=1 Tax=Gigantopelta aegis TaxID=1735272 RepID=UPI001B88D3CF